LQYPRKAADFIKAIYDHVLQFDWDYFGCMPADDLAYPGFVRAMLEAVGRYPQAGVCFSNYHWLNRQEHIIGSNASGFESLTFLEGAQIKEKLCQLKYFEGAAGTIIRRDAHIWINEAGCTVM